MAIDVKVMAANVLLGVTWMDANHPGWANTIKTDKLVMSDSCGCILGQTCGNYYAALEIMFGHAAWHTHRDWVEQHGFQVPIIDDIDDETLAFLALGELWLPHIQVRQVGSSAPVSATVLELVDA